MFYNCKYHSCNGPVQKEKDNVFKYPCIQHVSATDNKPTCIFYSKTNKLGHFGEPKIIFGATQVAGVLEDLDGQYGMCEHCASIIDTIENIPFITKALISKEFIELMKMCDVGGNRDRYNRRVIAEFRKDFWKEFI